MKILSPYTKTRKDKRNFYILILVIVLIIVLGIIFYVVASGNNQNDFVGYIVEME